MPVTFPNPTYGPTTGTGFGTCNSNIIGGAGAQACNLAQPSNLVPGFPQSITEMVLAISGGSPSAPAVTTAAVNLLAQAGNSSNVCKFFDLHTDGGVIPSVTVAPTGVQWATIHSLFESGISSQSQGAGAVYLGPATAAPNSLQFNTNPGAFVNGGIFGFGTVGAPPNVGIPGTPPFAAGPDNVNPNMQTFAICVNTDPVGNVNNQTFSTVVTINGAGVGPIKIPVNMVIGGGTAPPPPAAKFSELGIFRGPTGSFAVDEDNNSTFDLPGDRIVNFGQNGDIPVAGDWDGSGIVRIGVYRPANGHWYLDMNNNGIWDGAAPGLDADIQFGAATQTCVPTSSAGLAACQDIPVVGDWGTTPATPATNVATGKSLLGIFRAGKFFLDSTPVTAGPTVSHNTFTTFSFGQPGDIPVAANWTNTSAIDQIGVYRKGTWFVNATGDGVFHPTDPQYVFGDANTIPVVGNWNNSIAGSFLNKKIGVFNSVAQWFLDLNNNHVFDSGVDAVIQFGEPVTDLPVVGTYTLP